MFKVLLHSLRPNSPALNRPLNVSLKNLFVFHLNSMNISEVSVLKLHQFSLNSKEKHKSFLMTHLMDDPSVRGK